MRCTSSFFFIAAPRPLAASSSSLPQLVGHALFAAVAAVGDQPANGQRGAPVGIHLDRHLIVGAAHAAGLHLEQRLAVLDRLLEELESVVAAALLFEVLHRLVEDALGRRLLAAPHHRVDKLGDQRRTRKPDPAPLPASQCALFLA